MQLIEKIILVTILCLVASYIFFRPFRPSPSQTSVASPILSSPATNGERSADIYKLLQHPLLLLLITALISNYLIPKITKRWQDHQKEVELKINFVSEISESVLSIVMAVQFAEVGAVSQTQEQYDKSYRDWEIKKAIIGSKIRGYFPQTTLGHDWDRFSEIVSEVYALSGTTDPKYRNDRINRIKIYFSSNDIDWKSLYNVEMKKIGFNDFQKFYGAWFSLRNKLLAKKDELLQRILDSPIELFRQ